jgi:uncharacterized protein YuzB (UPF0349 family)
MNVRTMKNKIKQLVPDAKLKIGCKSYCGPCSRFAFIFINGRYVTGATEDEALEKMKKYIR